MVNEMNQAKDFSYKFLTLLSAIYVNILLLTMVVENHIVLVGSVKILSGTLVLPLAYALSDVITEIYGYYQMRRLIWISMIVLYISAFIIYIILSLPTDFSIKESVAYNIVFKPFLKDVFTYSIAAFLSIFLNSYFLSKWKILIGGRLFWLRSLGATIIGEAIFILVWGLLGFSDKFPMFTLLNLMFVSYLYKLIYNLFAIVPTSILVTVLSNVERDVIYNRELNFNPFAWQT